MGVCGAYNVVLVRVVQHPEFDITLLKARDSIV
jgi:hypothetical protein